MMAQRLAPHAALALLLMAGGALAIRPASAGGVAATPEAAHGEHIARLICSACHVVAVNQEYPPLLRQATPSFVDIANRPGVSVASLRHFITTTHWDESKLPMSMPNPMLTDAEARDVARYIVSLRSH